MMPDSATMSKIQRVDQMRTAYMEKDRAAFESYFTDDVEYRPGALEPSHGSQALWDYLGELYSPITIDQMKPRGIWEFPDVVIYEYDVTITYVADRRRIEFPCVDIFAFKADKIASWRVYPLHPSFVGSLKTLPLSGTNIDGTRPGAI